MKEAIVFRDKAVAELEAGQRNLETLRAEAAAQAQEPRIQPTVVSDESDQVSSLKARISQLEREHEDHRQKRARSLSVPSRDLSVLSPHVSLQEWGALHDKSVGLDAQERSRVMENMIARGDSLARSSNRFNPLQ